MNPKPPRGLTLDAGALIALERANAHIRSVMREARQCGALVDVPVTVLAQAWRGGPRQARLARSLCSQNVSVVAMDEPAAKEVGTLCGESGHSDIVDAHVAFLARERGHRVLTSDPDDIRQIAPDLEIFEV